MKNQKKILILQLQGACYNSYTYFSGRIAHELRRLGHHVSVFSTAEKPLEELARFAGQSFDAVVDCNSAAPRITTDENGYFLDTIDAPFFNLLLDHPLYHHDSLKCTLKNYHVRCLDENHAAYVKKYYPHIQSTGLWTATGSSADEFSHAADVRTDESSPGAHPAAIRDRGIPALFCATYTDPEDVQGAIRALPEFIQEDLNRLIDALLSDPKLTIEGAVTMLGDSLNVYLPEAMPLFVQSCFLADTYVRAHRRRAFVNAAARAGLPVWLVGADWDKLPLPADSHVSIRGSVPYTETFALMADSRLTLNLMPEFKAGFHDRIFSAMLNGSVAVTDPSMRLLREFTDGRELLFYDVLHMDAGCERLREVLEKPRMLQQIADAGLTAANEWFTWKTLVSCNFPAPSQL